MQVVYVVLPKFSKPVYEPKIVFAYCYYFLDIYNDSTFHNIKPEKSPPQVTCMRDTVKILLKY